MLGKRSRVLPVLSAAVALMTSLIGATPNAAAA